MKIWQDDTLPNKKNLYQSELMKGSIDEDDEDILKAVNSVQKKKPIILPSESVFFTGHLKFFDENKQFGFIICDQDQKDVFLHIEDIKKAELSIE